MDKRDEIIKRLNSVQKKEKAIRKELESLDYDNRLKDAMQYTGKYFKKNDTKESEYFRGMYIYGVDKETCQPKGLEISYWSDKDDWFSIENEYNFTMRGYDDEKDRWIEITKEEFELRYSQVQARINKAYITNDPTFGTKKQKNGKTN